MTKNCKTCGCKFTAPIDVNVSNCLKCNTDLWIKEKDDYLKANGIPKINVTLDRK